MQPHRGTTMNVVRERQGFGPRPGKWISLANSRQVRVGSTVGNRIRNWKDAARVLSW